MLEILPSDGSIVFPFFFPHTTHRRTVAHPSIIRGCSMPQEDLRCGFFKERKIPGWPRGCDNFIFSRVLRRDGLQCAAQAVAATMSGVEPFFKKAPEGGRLSNRHKEEWQWQKEQ